MRRAPRGSSQISRLTQTPLGCLKLVGTFILFFLIFGRVTHV
jgi:hypothetical protein